MNRTTTWTIGLAVVWVALLGGYALSAEGKNKDDVKVPGGLAMSEFKGFEGWQTVSVSLDNGALASIVANPVMIDAFLAGIPENGHAFPDGAKMAKIHWRTKSMALFPQATVPGDLFNVDFMMKDSKRFADGGGWGYASFDYDTATDTYEPSTTASKPPQGNDAKCGTACHSKAKIRDYVFTEYGKR